MVDARPTSSPAPTPDPVVVAAAIAAVVLAGFVILLLGLASSGGFAAPPGPGLKRVDFISFWGAARLALEGRPGDAYSWPLVDAELRRALGRPVGAPLPFYYPPIFLMLIKPLGALSYGRAFLLWVAATLGAYTLAAAAVLRRPGAVMTALAAPGVLCCIFIGQNGLFTAAAMMAGLALLPRRPALAGVFLGLLAAKPHLAILLPFALALDRRWRALAACAATAAGLLAASTVVLGPHVLRAFVEGAEAGGSVFAAEGWTPWSKVQTVYGVARNAGLAPSTALALHALGALIASAAVLTIWRRRDAAYAAKAAALAAGALLVTPYVFIYDTPMLGAAAVFLLRDAGERGAVTRSQAIVGACAYFGSLVFYADHDLPVTPLAAAGLLALVWLRARAAAPARTPALAAA